MVFESGGDRPWLNLSQVAGVVLDPGDILLEEETRLTELVFPVGDIRQGEGAVDRVVVGALGLEGGHPRSLNQSRVL